MFTFTFDGRPGRDSAVLTATVEYPARSDRTIEVPLSTPEVRRLHRTTGAIVNEDEG